MKCCFVHPVPMALPDKGIFPIGRVIDVRKDLRFKRKHIIQLCQIGACQPADEECTQAVERTPRQLIEAQRSYGRVSKGIHPDDFEDFDAGRMAGYDTKGEPIPGPCAVEEDLDIAEEEDEEDENE